MPKHCFCFQAFVIAIGSLIAPGLSRADSFRFHHEDVLGTSLELHVEVDSRSTAQLVERKILDEIDRLSLVFSSYHSESELGQFQRLLPSQRAKLSPELLQALSLCSEWTYASRGAFSPATELLTQVWKNGENNGAIPDRLDLNQAVQRIQRRHWTIDPEHQVAIRTSSVPLSLNAIAKGIILDRASEIAFSEIDGVQGLLINIGGDLRVLGTCRAAVSIAQPDQDAIGAAPLTTLTLSNTAVATSGDSERRFVIAGQEYSHIIDPRTGMPCQSITSATVVADEATTADVVVTICSVLSIDESLALVNALPGVDCLLVASATGNVAMSANWPQSSDQSKKVTQSEPPPTGHKMLVEFEIGKPQQSRRYRRPYVAVWIEDKDKFPVKTLSLFLMQNNPGPRWYRDVRRWYADDQMRKLVDSTDLIATVSKPTRNPGKYKIAWDGRDNSGELLEDGKYTLLIEAAREHGTYQLIKHEFALGKSFKKELKGNVEIASAKVSYDFQAKK